MLKFKEYEIGKNDRKSEVYSRVKKKMIVRGVFIGSFI